MQYATPDILGQDLYDKMSKLPADQVNRAMGWNPDKAAAAHAKNNRLLADLAYWKKVCWNSTLGLTGGIVFTTTCWFAAPLLVPAGCAYMAAGATVLTAAKMMIIRRDYEQQSIAPWTLLGEE